MDKKIYNEALKLVQREKNCSISYIQRTLGIGYNTASDIVKQLEIDNIVSPCDKNGIRTILKRDK